MFLHIDRPSWMIKSSRLLRPTRAPVSEAEHDAVAIIDVQAYVSRLTMLSLLSIH